MTKPVLEIKDLCAKAGDKQIIKNLNLTIMEGEVHALMGPNFQMFCAASPATRF